MHDVKGKKKRGAGGIRATDYTEVAVTAACVMTGTPALPFYYPNFLPLTLTKIFFQDYNLAACL